MHTVISTYTDIDTVTCNTGVTKQGEEVRTGASCGGVVRKEPSLGRTSSVSTLRTRPQGPGCLVIAHWLERGEHNNTLAHVSSALMCL